MRISSQDIGMEFSIEKCARLERKSGKRLITEGVELQNQVIKTFGEKETYKNLGILGADTIKQMEMKEKIKNSIAEESENYSRQSSIAETLSKG